MRKIIICILIIMLSFVIAPEDPASAEDITISINSGTVVNQNVSFTISALNTHLDKKEKFTIDFGDMKIVKGCSLKFDITFNSEYLTFWGFDYVDGRTTATFYAPVAVEGFTIKVVGHDIGAGYFGLFYNSYGTHKLSFAVRDTVTCKEFVVYHYDLSGCYVYAHDNGTSRKTTYYFYISAPMKGLIIFDKSFLEQKIKFDSSLSRDIDVGVTNSSQDGEHIITIQPVTEDGKEDDIPKELKINLTHKDVFTKATIDGKQGKDGYYIEYPELTFTTLDSAYVKWGYTQALENASDGKPVCIIKSPIYYQGFNRFGFIESIQKIDLKIDADEINMDVSMPECTKSSYFTANMSTNVDADKYYSVNGQGKKRFYGSSVSIFLPKEGKYNIEFSVVTVGGRNMAETKSIIYDKTVPVVKIDIPEATINDSVSLTFTSNEEVTVKEFETEGNIIKNVPAGKKVTITFIDKVGNETKQTVFVKKIMMVTMTIGSTSYTVNGEVKVMDVAPFVKNGRAFVPIRVIAEAFGATVSWDNGVITIQKEDKTITFKIGDTEAKVRYTTLQFDTLPFIKDGRTFVPVRFIAEAFIFEVKWDNGVITIKEAL